MFQSLALSKRDSASLIYLLYTTNIKSKGLTRYELICMQTLKVSGCLKISMVFLTKFVCELGGTSFASRFEGGSPVFLAHKYKHTISWLLAEFQNFKEPFLKAKTTIKFP